MLLKCKNVHTVCTTFSFLCSIGSGQVLNEKADSLRVVDQYLRWRVMKSSSVLKQSQYFFLWNLEMLLSHKISPWIHWVTVSLQRIVDLTVLNERLLGETWMRHIPCIEGEHQWRRYSYVARFPEGGPSPRIFWEGQGDTQVTAGGLK